jgi:hypothetical protein
MARPVAFLPAGSRITDYIGLGIVEKFLPVEKVHGALNQAKRTNRRVLEKVQWLLDPPASVKVAGKSGTRPHRRTQRRKGPHLLVETIRTADGFLLNSRRPRKRSASLVS